MSRRALKAYGQAAIENQIEVASPHKLIAMLYDGALQAIARAQLHLARGEIGPKGEAISRALAIIDGGLAASVDHEAGGDLARNLGSLYDYCVRRLIHANVKNDAAALEEVERILRDLNDAWCMIAHDPAVQAAPARP